MYRCELKKKCVGFRSSGNWFTIWHRTDQNSHLWFIKAMGKLLFGHCQRWFISHTIMFGWKDVLYKLYTFIKTKNYHFCKQPQCHHSVYFHWECLKPIWWRSLCYWNHHCHPSIYRSISLELHLVRLVTARHSPDPRSPLDKFILTEQFIHSVVFSLSQGCFMTKKNKIKTRYKWIGSAGSLKRLVLHQT